MPSGASATTHSEAAHHRERAVREVDEVHQAHRHRQAEADQEQQAAVGDAVEEDADEAVIIARRAGEYRPYAFPGSF